MEDGPTHGKLRDVVDAFNSHDIDRVITLFSDDCILEMPRGPHPYGSRAEGSEDVRKLLMTRFEGIPDIHYGDDSHYIDGNTGISKWLITGTSPTGEPMEVRGCDFLEFRAGLIIRKDSYWKIVERA